MAGPTLKLLVWIFLTTISLLALGLAAYAVTIVKSDRGEPGSEPDRGENQRTAAHEYVKGGRPLSTAGCDHTLQASLVTQRGVTEAGAVNILIENIQMQRANQCNSDWWDPKLNHTPSLNKNNDSEGAPRPFGSCHLPNTRGADAISLLPAYAAARNAQEAEGEPAIKPNSEMWADVQKGDGIIRSPGGDILIEFDPNALPDSGSRCWLYSATQDVWYQTEPVTTSEP